VGGKGALSATSEMQADAVALGRRQG
jgi:hypothetical protein